MRTPGLPKEGVVTPTIYLDEPVAVLALPLSVYMAEAAEEARLTIHQFSAQLGSELPDVPFFEGTDAALASSIKRTIALAQSEFDRLAESGFNERAVDAFGVHCITVALLWKRLKEQKKASELAKSGQDLSAPQKWSTSLESQARALFKTLVERAGPPPRREAVFSLLKQTFSALSRRKFVEIWKDCAPDEWKRRGPKRRA